MTDLKDLLPAEGAKLYKQEATIGRYQGGIVMQWCEGVRRYFKHSYGDIWMFWDKGEHAQWFFLEDCMHAMSKEFLEMSKDSFPTGWETQWLRLRTDMIERSKAISKLTVSELSMPELKKYYLDMLDAHRAFWSLAIFIDSFDAGEDQDEMERIAKTYSLTSHEVEVLVSATVPSYAAAWEKALSDVRRGARSAREVAEEFFWVRSDYHYYEEVDEEFVVAAAKDVEDAQWTSLKDEKLRIVGARELEKNPLQIFETLTDWRDERKRVNFVGLYALMRLLTEAGRRYAIAPEQIRFLMPLEAHSLFDVEPDALLLERLIARRSSGTFMRAVPDGTYFAVDGDAAIEARSLIQKNLPQVEGTELKGMTASRGVARGKVRLVTNPGSESAKDFREGDILVTSMTRPEFVPLMRLSAAIVTDEGGITSHAAIVSRELKKPCIIGTKYATQLLKDGDMVEVDADKGIVTKL